MTAAEFMTELGTALYGLSNEERESALEYYREYFEEAGDEADAAAESLGSPQSVAERIIAESGEGRPFTYETPVMTAAPSDGPDGAHIFTMIAVVVLTFPLWITVFSLWITLLVILISLLASFGVSAIGAPIQGIMLLISGDTGSGLVMIGGGLVCAGLTLLLWKPFWLLGKITTVGLFRLCKNIIFGLLGRNEL